MYYGMEMSDYLEQAGESEEDFEKEIEDECKETLKMQMVCEYIADKEKLELSDDEYDDKLQEMTEENGYDSADAMIEDYASQYGADDADADSEDEESSGSEDASEEEADEVETDTVEVSEEAKQKAEDELRQNFLVDKVSNWLVENAVRVESTDESAESEE